MADIMVSIDSIQGESNQDSFLGQIECTSMEQSISLNTDPTRTDRVDGASHHSPISLDHSIDKATPKLRLAALRGQNLGAVRITVLRMVEGSSQPVETVHLADAYVVNVETSTGGTAMKPDDEPVETFSLSYSSIRWENTIYIDGANTGVVSGGWDLGSLSAMS